MHVKSDIIKYIASKKSVKRYELNEMLANSDYTGKSDEELYLWLHEYSSAPCCRQCHKPVKFVNLKIGYNSFCSVDCGKTHQNLLREESFKRQTRMVRASRSSQTKYPTISFDFNIVGEQNKTTSLINITPPVSMTTPTTLRKLFEYKNVPIIRHQSQNFKVSQIHEYINQLGFNVITNTEVLPSLNVDIFIPDKNIAIDYCGLYWHSENNIYDKNYRYLKWKHCYDNGIQLITIFEDEWMHHETTCKSVLKHILGCNKTTVYARKCSIRQLDMSEYKYFIARHHLQKRTSNITIAYGLEYNNQLVAVMSFKKSSSTSFYTGDNIYELVRFATNGANVIGAASKLLKHFIKIHNPDVIVTFADLRWSTGKLYYTLGFSYDGFVIPDYTYVKNNNRYHKFGFRKDKIARRFGIDITGKTESILMEELGFDKIYDCGKIRFVMKLHG